MYLRDVKWIQSCAIAAICLTAFAFIALFKGSIVASAEAMDAYFGGMSPTEMWNWHGSWTRDAAPFAYRILFKGSVDLAAKIARVWNPTAEPTRQYWTAFISLSALAFVFAGLSLDWLVQLFTRRMRDRLFALGLWLALPAIHLAYRFPVQTKEDFLAYGLFFLGIRAVLLKHLFAAVIISFLGALTRETLLLIPLMFFFSPERSFLSRTIPLSVGAVTLIAVRLLIPATPYDPFIGGRENLDFPFQTLAALFFMFGYGWVVIVTPKRLFKFGPETKELERRFWTCFYIAFPLLPVAHIIFGRIIELRISCLLAPWIVIGALALFAKRTLADALVISSKGIIAFFVIATFELMGFGTLVRRAANTSIGEFGQRIWWAEAAVQIFMLASVIACLRDRWSSRSVLKPTKKAGFQRRTE